MFTNNQESSIKFPASIVDGRINIILLCKFSGIEFTFFLNGLNHAGYYRTWYCQEACRDKCLGNIFGRNCVNTTMAGVIATIANRVAGIKKIMGAARIVLVS